MITALRLLQKRQESSGSPPATPSVISYAEHTLALQELQKAYEKRLAEAGAPVEEPEQAARILELEALVSAADGIAEKFGEEQAKSEAQAKQLDALTTDFNALGERLAAEEKKGTELASELASALERCAELEALFDEATKAPTTEVAPAEAPAPAPSSPTPAADAVAEQPPTKPDAAAEKSEAAESKASGKKR